MRILDALLTLMSTWASTTVASLGTEPVVVLAVNASPLVVTETAMGGHFAG